MRYAIGRVLVWLWSCASAVAQLPPEVTADRYLMRAEHLVGEKNYAGARDLVNRIVALQGKHAVALPDTFHFRYAQAAWAAGAIPVAIDAVNRYLDAAGMADAFYREALALRAQAETAEPGTEPAMVVIPAGRFLMGCLSGSGFGRVEKPVREVSVASFEISRYEATFAQWEYAARAGATTKYSWGNEIGRNRANCEGCGSRWDNERTAPVGSFVPNAWGLYDMHGNVLEWVQDCWNANYVGAPADGSARQYGDCTGRVLHGGYWGSGDWNLGAAFRDADPTRGQVQYISGSGFRVARTVEP